MDPLVRIFWFFTPFFPPKFGYYGVSQLREGSGGSRYIFTLPTWGCKRYTSGTAGGSELETPPKIGTEGCNTRS